MTVGTDIDHIRVGWVKDEIEQSLRQAAKALEAHVEAPEDESALKSCAAHLHQVAGALQILELGGPGILALEMEHMAAALARGDIGDQDAAFDALLRAILQLPDQLERLQSGQRDVPLALLPAINELRTLRDERPLDESALFFPDLSVFMPVQRADKETSPSELTALAHRLRPLYQRALVAWYQAPGKVEELQRLGAILARLSEASSRYALIQLWWVGCGLVQALLDGSIVDVGRCKQLLGQLDQQIRRLTETSESEVAEEPPERLVRELLYHLARSHSTAPVVQEIRETFRLDALFPHHEEARRPIGPNMELLRTVSSAIKEDLAKAKDVLDVFVAAPGQDAHELEPLVPALTKVADILTMVGLESSQEAVAAQAERLTQMIAGASPCGEDELMQLAAVLLTVENTLDELARGHVASGGDHADAHTAADAQFDAALAGVAREAISDLALVKDAIVAYLSDPAEKYVLEVTPRYFERIGGCLRMLSQERAAAIADRLRDLITTGLLNIAFIPPRATLDQLADAITALESFVEAIRDHRSDADRMLVLAAERLEQLGFPLDGPVGAGGLGAAISPDVAAQFAETRVGDEQVGLAHAEETATTTDEGQDAAPAEVDATPTLEISLTEYATTLAAPDSVEDAAGATAEPIEPSTHPFEPVPTTVPDPGTAADEADPDAVAEPPIEPSTPELEPVATAVPDPVAAAGEAGPDVVAKPLAEEVPPATFAALAADADPDTVEIFVEEAQELQEVIADRYARWKLDANDAEALAELRRSFHTLKGSGRLVGAQLMGEFAWAIENLLNRVIEETVAPSNALHDLFDQAATVLPDLIEQLQGTGEPSADITQLIADAEFLALPTQKREETVGLTAQAMPSTVPHGDEDRSEPAEAMDVEPVKAEEAPDETAAQPDQTLAADVPDQAGAMDAVLYEIFSQETEGHLVAIQDYVRHCREVGGPCQVTDDLQRALHTLHGSARMAGVLPIAGLTGALERYAKLLHTNQGHFLPETLPVLEEGMALIREIFRHLNDSSVPLPDTSELLDRIAVLESKEHTTQIMRIEGRPSEGSALERLLGTHDPLTAFLEEAGAIVDAAEVTVQQWHEDPAKSGRVAELLRDMQTLKRGAAGAGMDAVAGLSEAVELLLEKVSEEEPADELLIALVTRAVSIIAAMLDQGVQGATVVPAPALIDEIGALAARRAAAAEEAAMQLLLPSDETAPVAENDEEPEVPPRPEEPASLALDDEAKAVAPPEEAPAEVAVTESEVRATDAADHEAKATAPPEEPASLSLGDEAPADVSTEEASAEAAAEERASGARDAADEEPDDSVPIERDFTPTLALSRKEVEAAWQREDPSERDRRDAPASDDGALAELTEIFLEEAEEILNATENTLEIWSNNPANSGLIRELERKLHTLKGGARMAELTPVADLSHAVETLLTAVADGRVLVSRDLFDGLHRAVDGLVQMVEQVRSGEAVNDPAPLLGTLESIVTGRDRGVTDSTVMELPPELTTQIAEAVSGSAAEEESAEEDGEAAPVQPEAMATPGPEPVDAGEVRDVVESGPVEPVEAAEPVEPAEAVKAPAPEHEEELIIPALEAIIGEESFEASEIEPAIPQQETASDAAVLGDEDERSAQEDRRQQPRVQHETVRVRADLIDNLVNYAGEVGIYRARLEQQAATFRTNLTELEDTVRRLNHQLRGLEIETEAQILYRYEKEGEAQREDFDPLELDRFSTMQQLSRALAESVNDLGNLHEMLGRLNRESETLLLQQSRVSNVLQEGLMRSRMVQFGGLMPRMRRIVRQACQELGKWAKLHVDGAGVEMDTTVIDRVLPALEHILRNAVAHGIETPEVRRERGKEDTGHVLLDLSRDGPDVVMRVSDDGAGIDVEAIRRKAIERGMVKDDTRLRDEDLVQLILESGLSTAERITQISGRGVGMDVVVNEVKQLGGSMHIESRPGQGTTFTLRLPFTLAINRALLVHVGEDPYAIPLANVVGIVRMSGDELESYQSGRQRFYDYGGGRYEYRPLAALLGARPQPGTTAASHIPVLMVRSGEQHFALQVDAVMGSRDVVVKSLGRQLNAVRGLLGATILADGRVVLILDVGALAHRSTLLEAAQDVEREAVSKTDGRPTVLVVDDSITIRKVTSRLLERHEMQALTARDGVDALAVMQETVPDVILLDIEMPRMDGYDLAAHLRGDARLQHVPIVMITSRTGEKHRQRALDLGVDHYLGKPYQEAELIAVINEMLDKRSASVG